MIDKNSILQIFGCLMKHPQYLSETDRYNLTPNDFYYKLHKYIFVAIDNLYQNGAKYIQPIDVENYLSTNAAASVIFKQNNGIEYLQDAIDLSEDKNFEFYYSHLKKVNLLNSLNNSGFSTDEFYIEDLTNPKALEINEKFEKIDIDDIIESKKRKLLSIEHDFIKNDSTETCSAFENIRNIIENAKEGNDIGLPVQGEIFNEVISGARLGTFVVRSAGSGTGKSRSAVGDACYLAFPFRYSELDNSWVQIGNSQKVLYIATEQTIPEIQKMILAYLTGFNESKFRFGGFTKKEEQIINQALWIMEKYQNNFFIVQMPNPSISLIKNLIREQVLLHEIQYVFYDYIFVSASLLNEFKGVALRNDEILLLMSTALKELAVELNIFILTSTQVNANSDNNTGIKNESVIAGSRAIVNKADVGVVMSRPTKEELDLIAKTGKEIPNMVTDIYKVRSGEWTQMRIWSYFDYGCLRKTDLFMTDARLEIVDYYEKRYVYEIDWENTDYIEVLKEVNEVK